MNNNTFTSQDSEKEIDFPDNVNLDYFFSDTEIEEFNWFTEDFDKVRYILIKIWFWETWNSILTVKSLVQSMWERDAIKYINNILTTVTKKNDFKKVLITKNDLTLLLKWTKNTKKKANIFDINHENVNFNKISLPSSKIKEWWVSNLDEFNKYNKSWIFDRLKKFKEAIWWKDPIKFLIYLYLIKEFRINDIALYLKDKLKLDWPEDTLKKNFRNDFLWIGRDQKENSTTWTVTTNRKVKIKLVEIEVKKQIEIIIKNCWWIKRETELCDFEREEYVELRSIYKKTQYLLYLYWIIDSKSLDSFILHQIVINYQKAVSAAIKSMVLEITKKNNLPELNFWKSLISKVKKDYKEQ